MRKDQIPDDLAKAAMTVTQAGQDMSLFKELQQAAVLAEFLGVPPETDVAIEVIGNQVCLLYGGTPTQCAPKNW